MKIFFVRQFSSVESHGGSLMQETSHLKFTDLAVHREPLKPHRTPKCNAGLLQVKHSRLV
jgi:hypothetical protein